MIAGESRAGDGPWGGASPLAAVRFVPASPA